MDALIVRIDEPLLTDLAAARRLMDDLYSIVESARWAPDVTETVSTSAATHRVRETYFHAYTLPRLQRSCFRLRRPSFAW